MMKTLLAALIVVAPLAACAPTEKEIAAADPGQFPENYQEIVRDYMRGLLFDPYSAVYDRWRGPSPGYITGGLLSGFEHRYGYRVCVDVNAKNRFGAYVGTQTVFFLIKNGAVVFEDKDRPNLGSSCNF